MKKSVLYLLLVTLPVISSVRVDIRRSPPGDIIESGRPNVTLHCDLQEGESTEVESVIWFYQGEVLRQTPYEGCLHQPAMADFLGQELGSGLEGSGEGSEYGSEAEGVLMEEDLISSEDYNDQETSGSGEPADVSCGVLPGQLSLLEVSREARGRYACAVVSGGEEGARSEELELSVECKNFFTFPYLSQG